MCSDHNRHPKRPTSQCSLYNVWRALTSSGLMPSTGSPRSSSTNSGRALDASNGAYRVVEKCTAQTQTCANFIQHNALYPPRNCWWCWLWAMKLCSAALGVCWPLLEKLSPVTPSTFCTGLNLETGHGDDTSQVTLEVCTSELTHKTQCEITSASVGRVAVSVPCTACPPAAGSVASLALHGSHNSGTWSSL